MRFSPKPLEPLPQMPYNHPVDTSRRMRSLPSVDRLLSHPTVQQVQGILPRQVLVDSIRATLDDLRIAIKSGTDPKTNLDHIALTALARAKACVAPSLGPAVNATGIVLHTGLGRAVLSSEARAAVASVAEGHSTLEIDPETGHRGSRQSHIEDILCKLTGAEAAMAVNNNAAAVFLAINSLAAGMDVIISRGQLVEIGGQFRVPDIIKRAGCRLVEVGTTNRTRIDDYSDALTGDSALILRVHPSNFRVVGFTEEASIEEMVELAHGARLPVIDDLGSGALIDLSRFGLTDEPMVQTSVSAGCDIVTFSGDKLLGGPQAGILVGSRESIDRCRTNPLARAVRIDKLSLAALEATLKLYLDPEGAIEKIPVLRCIARPVDDIEKVANHVASQIQKLVGRGTSVEVIDSQSEVGGGSLPGQQLLSKSIALKSEHFSSEYLSNRFRQFNKPIFGRIEAGRLLFDLRTVEPEETDEIVDCARSVFQDFAH